MLENKRLKTDKELGRETRKDRLCKCGHNLAEHGFGDKGYCYGKNMTCKCKKFRPQDPKYRRLGLLLLLFLGGCVTTEGYRNDRYRQERINNEHTESLSRHSAWYNELLRRIRKIEARITVLEDWNGLDDPE